MLKEEFVKKYEFNPPLYYQIYGHIELMLLKSCPIASNKKFENIGCNLCHSDQYYFEDRTKVKLCFFSQKCLTSYFPNFCYLYFVLKFVNNQSNNIF